MSESYTSATEMMRASTGIVRASRRVVSRSVELVVVREDDRDHPAERSADRLEQRNASVDVRPHLGDLGIVQPGRFVQHLAADVQLPDVVQEGRRADVFDPLGAEVERLRDSRRIDRDAIRMVLRVLVLRDEVPQDQQDAVVGLAQLAHLRGSCDRRACPSDSR